MLAEVRRDSLHLLADRRVIVGQVAVVAAGVDHAKRVALRRKIAGDGFHLRVLLLEINGDHAAHGGGHLIHQPARLAEIDVLHLLRDDGAGLRIHDKAVIQPVENRRDQHLERRRGGKPASAQHGAGNRRAEAADLVAHLLHHARRAANQRQRRAKILFANIEVIQLHRDRREALAVHDDGVIFRRAHAGNRVQIDRRRQHAAVVVVGVVAADFRAPRRGEEAQPALLRAETRLKPLHQLAITRLLQRQHILAHAVKRRHAAGKRL